MRLHREAVAQMLQTAERHVADRDVCPDPIRLPMEHRPDPQVVLVGPEAGLDLPQPTVFPDQAAWVAVWQAPGLSPRWEYHGQPKEVFMYELEKDARQELCALQEEPEWREQGEQSPPSRAEFSACTII